MPLPPLPHPHLIVLRSSVTVTLSALIAQAGWAAAFLGGEPQYRAHHEVGAWVTLAVCVANAVLYGVLRRSAGPVNLALAALLAVMAGVQVALGEAHLASALIFCGVLTLMLATALTSWTYRHVLPGP